MLEKSKKAPLQTVISGTFWKAAKAVDPSSPPPLIWNLEKEKRAFLSIMLTESLLVPFVIGCRRAGSFLSPCALSTKKGTKRLSLICEGPKMHTIGKQANACCRPFCFYLCIQNTELQNLSLTSGS